MSQFFIKISRMVLWVVTPLLFISNGTFKNAVLPVEVLDGNYVLKSNGVLNRELKGTVSFEPRVETASDGTPFSILKLNLNAHSSDSNHTIGFLISEEDTDKGISAGTYRVANNIEGFLNYFDGVFGFADIKGQGEAPFFANNGRITIYYADLERISGTIAVDLQNSNGKKISVKGNFTAIDNIKINN